ncbi:MarR family transcriptional regulator [Pseudophaeobacter sp.]|uniref:MarR family winged helix-turn-helix transcriptional regulator n=1 Tax=Pseudophaeobacter sp. TaxID=1971739 RepID=UPI0032993476
MSEKSKSQKPSPVRLRVFHQLQVAHSALFRAADRRTRQSVGLTTSQFAVLFVLSQRDGQPISEIAKHLSMGKSSLTGLVDRMVDRGLVARIASPSDGRVTNIHIQAAGAALLAEAKQETKHFNAALLKPFIEDEQIVIHRFLNHLVEHADDIINPTTLNSGDSHDPNDLP